MLVSLESVGSKSLHQICHVSYHAKKRSIVPSCHTVKNKLVRIIHGFILDFIYTQSKVECGEPVNSGFTRFIETSERIVPGTPVLSSVIRRRSRERPHEHPWYSAQVRWPAILFGRKRLRNTSRNGRFTAWYRNPWSLTHAYRVLLFIYLEGDTERYIYMRNIPELWFTINIYALSVIVTTLFFFFLSLFCFSFHRPPNPIEFLAAFLLKNKSQFEDRG